MSKNGLSIKKLLVPQKVANHTIVRVARLLLKLRKLRQPDTDTATRLPLKLLAKKTVTLTMFAKLADLSINFPTCRRQDMLRANGLLT